MRSPSWKAISAATLGDAPGAIAAFERALALAADDAQRCAAWIGIAAGHRVTSNMEPAFAALDRAQELALAAALSANVAHPLSARQSAFRAGRRRGLPRASTSARSTFAQRAGDVECEAQA